MNENEIIEIKKRLHARWHFQQDFDAAMQRAYADGLSEIDCLPYLERQAVKMGGENATLEA